MAASRARRTGLNETGAPRGAPYPVAEASGGVRQFYQPGTAATQKLTSPLATNLPPRLVPRSLPVNAACDLAAQTVLAFGGSNDDFPTWPEPARSGLSGEPRPALKLLP